MFLKKWKMRMWEKIIEKCASINREKSLKKSENLLSWKEIRKEKCNGFFSENYANIKMALSQRIKCFKYLVYSYVVLLTVSVWNFSQFYPKSYQ